jgi:hypothetical protein
METRKATREQAWSVGSWSDTVQEVSCHIVPQRRELTRDRQTGAVDEDSNFSAMQVEPIAVGINAIARYIAGGMRTDMGQGGL